MVSYQFKLKHMENAKSDITHWYYFPFEEKR